MITLRLINFGESHAEERKSMELNTLDLTRDEVVNVQGTSSFVHNLMCNLKIIRPGVWGLGGGGQWLAAITEY